MHDPAVVVVVLLDPIGEGRLSGDQLAIRRGQAHVCAPRDDHGLVQRVEFGRRDPRGVVTATDAEDDAPGDGPGAEADDSPDGDEDAPPE